MKSEIIIIVNPTAGDGQAEKRDLLKRYLDLYYKVSTNEKK